MHILKKIFDFYIRSSIHVAFSVLALVLMTNHMYNLRFDFAMAGLAFFGTVFAYNFIKYADLFYKNHNIGKDLKNIVSISIVALLSSVCCFLCLNFDTQIAALLFLGLTFLYAVPVFSSKRNFRNFSGIKIYIVALCWAGVTTLLPLVDADMPITLPVFFKFLQRFILIIILILIFEIIDLRYDAAILRTVPQKIGVRRTKFLGIALLFVFYFFEFFQIPVGSDQLLVNFVLVVITALFTIFAHPMRSPYYTSFWVESIPVFWLLLEIMFVNR